MILVQHALDAIQIIANLAIQILLATNVLKVPSYWKINAFQHAQLVITHAKKQESASHAMKNAKIVMIKAV
jgi:hypothetical protein